jgi:fructose-bisphosphate aldolase class II/tagatose 1,6-diphosphate aldolase GatY/KbaY
MLEPFASVLAGGPVGAFGCYELAMADGVLRAAGRGRVVVLVAGTSLRGSGAEVLVSGLRGACEASRARVCLQADHVHDLETVELACELGVQAVMADFSPLGFDANVAFTSEAVAIAREFGVAVEGELGRLPGGADADAPHGAGVLTDPEAAAEFVAATGVDCLAVALGNVHGALLPAPRALDWERLAAIRLAVDVPLALHGATGLRGEGVREAIRLGIDKVNVNTALRRAFLEATAAALPGAEPTADLSARDAKQAAAVEAVARSTMVEGGLAENSDLVGRL